MAFVMLTTYSDVCARARVCVCVLLSCSPSTQALVLLGGSWTRPAEDLRFKISQHVIFLLLP